MSPPEAAIPIAAAEWGPGHWPGDSGRDIAELFCGAEWTIAAWRFLPQLGTPCPLRLADTYGVTVLPMSVVDDHGRCRVVFSGGPLIDVGDALSSAVDPVAHTRRLLLAAREMLSPGDWLDLRPVRPDGLLGRTLGGSTRLPGFRTTVRPAGTSPAIARPGDTRPLSTKFTAHLRRAAATLSTEGELRWTRRVAPSTVELRAFLDRRAAQWQQRGMGTVPWPQQDAGFADFLAAAATGDSIVFDELSVGPRLAACDLYLHHGGRRLLYLRYFDVELARCSPGHLLLRESLRPERLADVHLTDFGRGAEPWKSRFGASDRALSWISLTAV